MEPYDWVYYNPITLISVMVWTASARCNLATLFHLLRFHSSHNSGWMWRSRPYVPTRNIDFRILQYIMYVSCELLFSGWASSSFSLRDSQKIKLFVWNTSSMIKANLLPFLFLPYSDGMRCCGSDWPGLCLFCCYQPLCVGSQQSWFGFCFINFPILLPSCPRWQIKAHINTYLSIF